jgi:YHS domain-containing protein
MSIDREGRGDRCVNFCPKKGESLMETKKCPVCEWEIQDGGIKVTIGGKEITVCCDDCANKAKENPAKYASAAA